MTSQINSELLKDFEWHRDKKGYSLALDRPRFGMRDGRGVANYGPPDRVIVANGGPSDLITHRPFARDEGGDLCRAFASVKTADELLRFVKDHGPLTAHLLPPSPPNPPLAKMRKILSSGESVDAGLENAKMFGDLLRLNAEGNTRKLASYFESDKLRYFSFRNLIGRVELVGDPDKGLHLKICPPNLLGALWYQLGLKLSQAMLRTCDFCAEVFEVGPGTQLRADAKFCCYEHKVKYHNNKRPRVTQRSKESMR
jgi:hypothetical protein